ncbi:MAG: hypothetical protein LH654_06265 [Thermoleophilia bacterium]|nr:hypothetical protein [Thermoleophilia bacterium]
MLFVQVPAESLVDAFRSVYQTHSMERHILPHVTVLFPFASAPAIDTTLEAQLPFHFAVGVVALYAEQGDVTWREASSFPLA